MKVFCIIKTGTVGIGNNWKGISIFDTITVNFIVDEFVNERTRWGVEDEHSVNGACLFLVLQRTAWLKRKLYW